MNNTRYGTNTVEFISKKPIVLRGTKSFIWRSFKNLYTYFHSHVTSHFSYFKRLTINHKIILKLIKTTVQCTHFVSANWNNCRRFLLYWLFWIKFSKWSLSNCLNNKFSLSIDRYSAVKLDATTLISDILLYFLL